MPVTMDVRRSGPEKGILKHGLSKMRAQASKLYWFENFWRAMKTLSLIIFLMVMTIMTMMLMTKMLTMTLFVSPLSSDYYLYENVFV